MIGSNQRYATSNATIVGSNNHITGDFNKIIGNNNTVVGDYNEITGSNNSVRGDGNEGQGNNNTFVGRWNTHGRGDCSSSSSKKRAKAEEVDYVECPTEAQTKECDEVVPEEDEDTVRCVVCIDRAPSCAVLPCMHRCLCCVCARFLAGDGIKARGSVACPMCTAYAEAIKVLF